MTIDETDITLNDEEKEKELYRKLRRKRKQNIALNTITVLLALGGIIWACNFFIRYYRYEITNDASIEQYITPINTRITGYIQEIRFREHQWVEAGDTLLIIDDREFRIKEIEAQASLLDAKNSRTILSTNIITSEANVAVSDANIEEAKAHVWKLEQDLERYTNLLKEESVSKQQYDQIKSDYEAQKARYNALVKQKESLRSVTNETLQKGTSIEANILRREADLEMARLNLSYTVITAPYSGFLGRRTIEAGQLVQAGQTISNLIKNDQKWIVANYREMQIENIYVGQDVKIRVDAVKNKIFRGKVTAISEATGSKYSLLPVDNSAGNFVKVQQRIPVRIDFVDVSDQDMLKFRAGMMVISEAIK